MTLNQTNRKKLAQALLRSSRNKCTDEEIEKAALDFIEGKKTKAELAEKLGITVQTLTARFNKLANPEEEEGTEG